MRFLSSPVHDDAAVVVRWCAPLARGGRARTKRRKWSCRRLARARGQPNVQALGAVLDETGAPVFAHNPDHERPIASISKLAAMLVVWTRGWSWKGCRRSTRPTEVARRREISPARGDDAFEPRSAARGADGIGQPRRAGAGAGRQADPGAAGRGDEREGAAARAQEHPLPGADGTVGEQRVDAARGDRDAQAGDRPPGAGADHAARSTRASGRQTADRYINTDHPPRAATQPLGARPATTTRATARADRSTGAPTMASRRRAEDDPLRRQAREAAGFEPGPTARDGETPATRRG
jgi:hypothetical protein